jgi:hypothetical protein
VSGNLRRLHNEDLHNFYASPNIIGARWVGPVARMGDMDTRSLLENLKERDHSEDRDVDGNIILGQILRK